MAAVGTRLIVALLVVVVLGVGGSAGEQLDKNAKEKLKRQVRSAAGGWDAAMCGCVRVC